MPTIKFSEVLSFTSEDPNHPADNLLRQETHRKWKCAAGLSEKQASVTLKLERLTSIRSIDLGNAGSAFVEVLAAREDANFKVLLVASSFMTPIESRNASDLHRVRMFGPDKLNKDVASEKWDRIKVVCTQPFNKNLQYGLSFVTVSSAGEEAAPTTPKAVKLGSFTLKEEDESDPISIGSVFARRREKEASSSPLSGAAAIRAASAAAATTSTAMGGGGGGVSSPGPGSLKRKALENSPDVGFYQLKKKPAHETTESRNKERDRPKLEREGSSTERRNTAERKEEKEKKKINERERGGGESSSSRKNSDRRKEEEETDKDGGETKRETHKKKREGSTGGERKREKENLPTTSQKNQRKTEPFASLMKDVVFVMSGYQNPQRSNLRDMMLDMGAKYKQDWEPSCSHLICAFTNTPKFLQVKGKGKIVTAKWITDCHKNKIRYPWRRYQLERGRNADESEDEVWAEELLPREERRAKSPGQKRRPSAADAADTDSYNMATDNESEEDTDDEIQRVLAKKKTSEREKESVKLQRMDSAERKDKNGEKKEPVPRKERETEREEEVECRREEEQQVKTANGKLRGEVGAKRAKVETSGDEPKKTVNGRKEGAGKEREASSLSIAEGWEKRKRGKQGEKGGKTVERKEAEANGFAKGGKRKQEEDETEDYDADTDVDEDNKKYLQPPDTSALPLPSLGDHFTGKTFFIYGGMDERSKKMVRRYVIAFNGTLEEYMTGEVQYVVTEDEWDENFDAALDENSSLQFVKPTWIWQCSNKEKLVPHQPYLVVPRE
ncbi:DNA repair protein XRCC1-like isoform X2 [Penaeus chinensis]|uniref:DNA repair protein XRCC1-like isoform X2 n=1 Tax=Penaeus chinensis TaxID=139456 RepID=UPI001FB6CCD4|nr:DNA repair protein XRCC1-like isoform X2 [Penaeus chinensis]